MSHRRTPCPRCGTQITTAKYQRQEHVNKCAITPDENEIQSAYLLAMDYLVAQANAEKVFTKARAIRIVIHRIQKSAEKSFYKSIQ